LTLESARADVTVFLEEPHGAFGTFNPTGHAAIYLSRVCAETPVQLRRCHPGEPGVVLSRYHRVGTSDWIAIPLIPYLYAVEQPGEVPDRSNAQQVANLRDQYRRKYLEEIVPDDPDGDAPIGDWTQLVGVAYDRTIYTFGIQTAEAEDDALIRALNAAPNDNHFNLLFHNCADFARMIVDFYYPGAIHRNFGSDFGIMTPEQAARGLAAYSKHHPHLEFTSYVIPQVQGSLPRSFPVRGVLECLLRSKKYMVPLAPLAALHPLFAATLAVAWMKRSPFDPRRVETQRDPLKPAAVAAELPSNDAGGGNAQ
jgi:hypothetical protein